LGKTRKLLTEDTGKNVTEHRVTCEKFRISLHDFSINKGRIKLEAMEYLLQVHESREGGAHRHYSKRCNINQN